MSSDFISSPDSDPAPESIPPANLLEPLPGFAFPSATLKSIPLPLEFMAAVEEAQQANHVKSFLPKFFNPLFRKQGVVNKLSLQALDKVGDSLRQLSEEIAARDRLIGKLAEHINQGSATNQEHHGRIIEFCRQLEAHLGTVAAAAHATDAQIIDITKALKAEIDTLVRAIQVDENSLQYLQGAVAASEAKTVALEKGQQQLKGELATLQAYLAGIAAVTDSIDTRLSGIDTQLQTRAQADLTAAQVAHANEQKVTVVQQALAQQEPQLAAFEEQLVALKTAHLTTQDSARQTQAAGRIELEHLLAEMEARHQVEIAQVARAQAEILQAQTRASHAQLEALKQAQAPVLTLRSDLEQHLAAVERKHEAEIAQLRDEQNELRSALTVLHHNQGAVSSRETTVARTAKAKRAGNTPEIQAGTPEKQRDFDAMYLAFENRFRGSRELIKERLKVNLNLLDRVLPVLRTAKGVTWPDQPDLTPYGIVDLGCGRGEWLETIAQHGARALGVDLNTYFVAECRERGLAVVEADAVAFLRTLPDNSLGLVSGFHIIEHLPLPLLLDLIAETRRVLVKGGMALFETPNCKNIAVGAANFFCDPTHQHPVFPETAQFLLKYAGFSEASLDYRLPAEGSPFDQTKPEQAALHGWFYGPRDYAVIGIK